ncbi:LTA synthase family protein [Lacticaseibacillus zhaodongensis]|uniref:LTA synthase family protein n=1 Tax=Lacticaseibacillus zhaodongensis TaxID=2668065 RepID=UPI0012D2AD94|nr:LTA synthase family protein [Lacticaseibacillus zhaodongensis]
MESFKKVMRRPAVRTIIGLLLMVAFVMNEYAFGVRGLYSPTINAQPVGLKWLVVWAIKLIMVIGSDAFLIYLFRLFIDAKVHVKLAVHTWLFVVTSGIILLGFTMVHGQVPGLAGLLDAMFPIVRNVVPYLTGMLIFMLLLPYLQLGKHAPLVKRLLLLAMGMAMLIGRDIWSFNAGSGLTAALCVGLVALLFRNENLGKNLRAFCGLALLAYLLTLFMSWATLYGQGAWNNSAQFIAPESILTLIPAVALVNVLLPAPAAKTQVQGAESWQLFAGILLVVVSRSASLLAIMTLLKNKVQALITARLGIWMLVSALALTVGVVIFTLALLWILKRTQTWRVLGKESDFEFVPLARDIVAKRSHLLGAIWHRLWPGALAFGLFYVLQTVATFFMYPGLQAAWKAWSGPMVYPRVLLVRIPAMVYGAILLMAIFWIIRGLTNRYWTALIATFTAGTLWLIADVVKIAARNEPIVPADIYELRSTANLVKMVSPLLLIAGVVIVVAVIALCIWLERKHPAPKTSWLMRVVQFIFAIAFMVGFRSYNQYMSASQQFANNFKVTYKIMNQMWAAQDNGPYVQFAQNIDVTPMEKPKGYSKAAIDQLAKKYGQEAAQINKTRTNDISKMTVMFNLSESFSDPTRVPNVHLDKDPIPNIRAIKKQTTSGLMMSHGYGGGTADMEWETLTGMSLGNLNTTLSTPYTQLVSRQQNGAAVSTWFKYSSAIHPFNGSEYNRQGVYEKFNFNKFAALDSKYPIKHRRYVGNAHTYLSDYTAYDNALDQLQARKGGQFLNLITIQNHMPYTPTLYSKHDFKASGSAFTTADLKGSFESYAMGLHYTDDAAEKFMHQIDAINKPIIWVFYGDHLGALYNGDSSSKYAVPLHQTDYFIYANKYARAHGAKTKLSNTKQVGSSDFIAMAFAQANAKVDPFVALLTKVQKTLPTIWMRSDNRTNDPTYGMSFVNKNGKEVYYNDLSKKQKATLHDYQLLEYDITAGKQYALQAGMQK